MKKKKSIGDYYTEKRDREIEKREMEREQKKLDFVIPFGKHKGKMIKMMTTREEINYAKWFVKNMKNKKNKTYKALKWWIGQID